MAEPLSRLACRRIICRTTQGFKCRLLYRWIIGCGDRGAARIDLHRHRKTRPLSAKFSCRFFPTDRAGLGQFNGPVRPEIPDSLKLLLTLAIQFLPTQDPRAALLIWLLPTPALGRSPLVKDLIADGQLVAPFKSQADPARAYFAIVSRNAATRPEVTDFVDWLKAEASKK